MLIRTREQFLPGGVFNPRGQGFRNGKPLGFQKGTDQRYIGPGSKRKHGLTLKQRAFVQGYLTHGNARKAASEAGYSHASAAVNAVDMLNHPVISAEIAKVQEHRRQRHEVT